jgi:hypothetical protein
MVLALILALTPLLSGCYIVQSGKMNWIEGTYQLTSYGGKSDYMAERGIKIFMVIRSDGTGWYGYQSNNSEPYITELRCRFTQDTEKSGYYSYVEIDFAGNGTYENFGIQASRTDSSLNSSEAVWAGNLFEGDLHIDYYITSRFERVDKSTELDKLKELFGDHPVMPRGIMNFDGTYEGFGLVASENSPSATIPDDPFVYLFVDIDLLNGKGKAWYMLRSDEQAKTNEFAVSILPEATNGFMLKFDDVQVRVERSSSSGYVYIPYTTDVGEFNLYLAFRADFYTDEEITQNVADIYNNYLANKPVE